LVALSAAVCTAFSLCGPVVDGWPALQQGRWRRSQGAERSHRWAPQLACHAEAVSAPKEEVVRPGDLPPLCSGSLVGGSPPEIGARGWRDTLASLPECPSPKRGRLRVYAHARVCVWLCCVDTRVLWVCLCRSACCVHLLVHTRAYVCRLVSPNSQDPY
jgi:hypothetical protein